MPLPLSASLMKYGVLLSFCINTASNSFMFMDFAAISNTSKAIFSTDDDGVNWLWTASLLAVLPGTIPATYFLPKVGWPNYLTTGFGAVCNVIGAWLRYYSVANRSYAAGIASSILIGFSAAVIISSIMQVSTKWFAKKHQALATSVAVQANYAGWALGVVLVPFSIPTSASGATVAEQHDAATALMFGQVRRHARGTEPRDERVVGWVGERVYRVLWV